MDKYLNKGIKEIIEEFPEVENVLNDYDQIKNSKIGSYEYALKKVEDKASPIIANIIKTKSIKDLSQEERETLSFFIALQKLRTKRNLLETKFSIDSLHNQIENKAKIKIPYIDPKNIWFSLLEDATAFYEAIMNKVWNLCESDKSFYISDNPIALQNTTDKSKFKGVLGLDSYGIEIYFPLSPSLTLCLFCEKLFKEKGYYKNYIDNTVCKPDNIENLNWLQVVYSERFIFSHKNDFDFVYKIIENHL